ncbi:MFS transporter [Myxococcus sp. MISCRS1]|jgi:predicted MFS family arabinose efflux permease|uniref:MFS transporter n=1 Tax=Myxococcus TaxID=32 RepID=UPI001CBDDBC2|nr:MULTISPECIES: MFS transporter [unclassified Myxococcus]MBZ4394457.1 MFS transporter [Myxococcus sp. AS-1-15]MBZ4410551.1 MFS transporter [Myxococcus sp. XM-1-1-1]MCY1001425.1 MFS transporter [Myxococcus sp. MISCRS1]BDT37005.1 MFS transporter [Myxococcus sp. MH1]
MPTERQVSERWVVFLIGAVQFVNILDFVMVMPLGPDFAKGLGIASSHIGTIGGAYTAAASVAGLLGGYFLDRYDRRRALAVSMLGLVVATAAGGLATGLSTLMLARVAAGIFGGPATSLSLSIIADLIPVERRGRALGAVMGAFSVASVAGVPMALKLAEHGGWRLPFFVVAALGLLVVVGAIFFLPPMRGHLTGATGRAPSVGVLELLGRREVQLSYLMTAVVMMAGFVLIPNISAYLQQNLGYPRDLLWFPYFVGGIVSFVTLRLAGPLVDRYGAFRLGTAGSVLLLVATYVGFVDYPRWLPIPLLFVLFMTAMGVRNVSYNTLTSRVPDNPVRARFMSLQSAIQHMASAVGAFLSAQLLTDLPDGTLGGMTRVAWVCMGLTVALPPMLWVVERQVRSREQARALAVPASQGLAVPLSPQAHPHQ